jgi:hypothetical protein
MADAPTEEQIVSANEAEMSRWEDDFDQDKLEVKSKPEGDDANDKATGKDNEEVVNNSGNAKSDTGAKEVDNQEEYSAPESVVTVDDPGDYQAADYSFEVTLKDGKTVKVSTPEEADKLADDPDNFETPKQLMDFINKQNKMNRNLDRDFDKWESQKKTFDDQTATAQERQQSVDNLVKGFEYLTAKGLLPEVDEADLTADWNDPEVAKHDGVKEQIELMSYMVKENASRTKAGIPLLTSALDAYNSWQLDTSRQREEQQHKEDGEARRMAGARVSGVSTGPQAPYVPKGISVGRTLNFRGGANWED